MSARAGGSVYLKAIADMHPEIKLKTVYDIANLSVWLVDGRVIRDWVYIDFTEGGNGEAYVWMPQYEIWLDQDVHEDEQKYVMLHELREYNEMCINGLDYESAHQRANRAELSARRDPEAWGGLWTYETDRYKKHVTDLDKPYQLALLK